MVDIDYYVKKGGGFFMKRTSKKLSGVLSIVLSLLMVISVISFPTLKASADEGAGTVDNFVERCYLIGLGRGSDPDGFADWKDQLLNGRAVGIEVAYGFIFSEEYQKKNKTDEEFVEDLYSLFMGRPSDEGGFNDWVGQLKDGKTRVEVYAGFANSQEFFNICDSYGVTAGRYVKGYDRKTINNVNLFVERLYKICLGRTGDKDGQKNWVEKLITKQISGSECARSFIFSEEYTNKNLSDEEFVENLYLAIMGRPSDADGKANWLKALDEGKTRDEVFAGFANSAEFAAICATYKIDKGNYTAKDIGKPKEPSKDEPEKPKFRMIKTVFSDGTYLDVKYNDENKKVSSNLYNADGSVKQVLYATGKNADGFDTEKIFHRDAIDSFYDRVYNADHTQVTTIYSAMRQKRSKIIEFMDAPDGNIIEKRVHTIIDDVVFDDYYKNTYSYNDDGSYKYTEFYTGEGERESYTEYTYDSKGNLLKTVTTHKDGTKEENNYTYDANGNLLTLKRYDNSRDEYQYDSNNNMISEKHYYGDELANKIDYSYNAQGLLSTEIHYGYNGDVSCTYSYEYDSNNNLIKKTFNYPDSPSEYEIYEYEQY